MNLRVIIVASWLALPACGSEVDGESMSVGSISESADPGVNHWGYHGEVSPYHWDTLHNEYALCSEGMEQSPIDLAAPSAADDLPDIEVTYGESSLRVENNGHTIQYQYDPGHYLLVGDNEYELLQFHFHALSEHTVDSLHYPMEMHLVHRHRNDDGRILVLGVFITAGDANAMLSDAAWDELPATKEAFLANENVAYNIAELVPGGRTYRYQGSFTTPPCTEQVRWIVYEQPVSFSPTQIAAFSRLYPQNRRPTSELGARQLAYGE